MNPHAIVHPAYVALGSNLGDKAQNLERALAAVAGLPATQVLAVSRFYQTHPVGGPPGQEDYLNAAAAILTGLSPSALIEALLGIEATLGRDRRHSEPNGPRSIDLDLLLYNDQTLDQPGLCVPHPRMHERRFVLEPLAQIAPDVRHPKLGRSIRELLQELLNPPAAPVR